MLTYWDKDVIDTFFGKIRQQFWNRILQWKKKLLAIMEDDFHRIIGSLEAPPYRQFKLNTFQSILSTELLDWDYQYF